MLVEIAKPLVDHRKIETSMRELRSFVESRGLKIGAFDLQQQLENFEQHGELSSELLLFLWRHLTLKVEDYPQIVKMLNASGVIVAQRKVEGLCAVVFSRLSSHRPDDFDEYWSKLGASADVKQATMSVAFYCGGCPVGLVQSVLVAVYSFGTVAFSWREGVVVTSNIDENEYWYHARLIRSEHAKLKAPTIDVVCRTKSQGDSSHQEKWFAFVLGAINTAMSDRFLGAGCEAFVECPKCKVKTTVWDSRSTAEGLRDVNCRCGQRLLAMTKVARSSDREMMREVIDRLGTVERRMTAGFGSVEARLDRNLNAVVDFAKDANAYPWLFMVLPADKQERFSLFSRRLVVVFVCERTLERVPYDGGVGLEFSVPALHLQSPLRAASRFWKTYGPIIKFGATFLANTVKLVSSFDAAALFPSESMRAMGAATAHVDFIDKYAEEITATVNEGTKFADRCEDANELAEFAASLDDEDLVKRARDSYVEFHDFLKSVGFDTRKLPMRWVPGDDGRVRWVRNLPEPESKDDATDVSESKDDRTAADESKEDATATTAARHGRSRPRRKKGNCIVA